MRIRQDKRIAKQDADFAVNRGNSNETSIKLTNEIREYFLPGPAGAVDIKQQVTFEIFKDDFVKSACLIVSRLPLYNKSGMLVNYSDTFYKGLFQKIDSFFGPNASKSYSAELFYDATRRTTYLQGFPSALNIRGFLIEKSSRLQFIKDTVTNLVELRIFHDEIQNPINVPPNIAKYVQLLLDGKQMILTGAPGTGKTFIAREIAKSLTGETLDGEHPHIGFCQFHPSMDYTDFVEGLRPIKRANQDIGFERRDGLFMDFCRSAIDRNDPNAKYVFIIDEINRGDISKIFGELFYCLEQEYRGPEGAIKTQYNNLHSANSRFLNGFYVPNNVYIIGTMNDVDRGVESIDFAIRRRFAWQEILPDDRFDEMLSPMAQETWYSIAKSVMSAINAKITDPDLGLGAAYCVGPAYFRKLMQYGGDFTKLWVLALEPLFKEYLRGDPDIIRKIAAIKNVYTTAQQPAAVPAVADGIAGAVLPPSETAPVATATIVAAAPATPAQSS